MSKPKDLTKAYYTLKKCPYTNEVISNEQCLLHSFKTKKEKAS